MGDSNDRTGFEATSPGTIANLDGNRSVPPCSEHGYAWCTYRYRVATFQQAPTADSVRALMKERDATRAMLTRVLRELERHYANQYCDSRPTETTLRAAHAFLSARDDTPAEPVEKGRTL